MAKQMGSIHRGEMDQSTDPKHRQMEEVQAPAVGLPSYTSKTDTKCLYCDREDSAEHTLISCPRWTSQRLRICETLGRETEALTPASVVEGMLDTAEKWGAIQECIIDIKKSKSVELAGGDG
ncbi:uncharacterized protein LOC132695739 [Cylas formicarius]|uniref:uncharacterized protein LOC132695739 n=1 Tax=Cylas formicarius TaxID=197179 RepID=UPI002958BF2C|nr:uncharacterized protein LOC132695739 [Cylas formicarius]